MNLRSRMCWFNPNKVVENALERNTKIKRLESEFLIDTTQQKSQEFENCFADFS